MGDDDLRERIARACEDAANGDPGENVVGYTEVAAHRKGLRAAARIARDTPVAHVEPAPSDRVSTAYRTLAARLWAERHGVNDLDVAFTVVDGMANGAARQPVNPRP